MLPDSKPICSSGLHDSFSTEIPSEGESPWKGNSRGRGISVEGEFPWISSEEEQLIIAVSSIVVIICCDARIHDRYLHIIYIIPTYKSFENHCW